MMADNRFFNEDELYFDDIKAVVENVIKNNELEFNNWLIRQQSNNGKPLKETTINHYLYALRVVLSKIAVEGYFNDTSLFEITDLSDFINVKTKIKSAANYDEVSKFLYNGALNTALDWYERFLKRDMSRVEFVVPIRRFMFGANSRITVPSKVVETLKTAFSVDETVLSQDSGYFLKLLINGEQVPGSCYIKRNSPSNVTIRYSSQQQDRLKEIFAYSYDMFNWFDDDKSVYETMNVEVVDNDAINFVCYPMLPEIENLVGNKAVLDNTIAEYINDFDDLLWKDEGEKYKWNNIIWFKEHWNIDADDFLSMLKEAFKNTGNLLDAGQNHLPLTGITNIATKEPETARQMFRQLYDENLPIENRIENFMNEADTCYSKYYSINSHDQNTNAISVYLWLKYPDKYYIYKYKEIKVVAKMLGSCYKPTISQNKLVESCVEGFNFYNAINYYALKNRELKHILSNALQKDGKPLDTDSKLHTMTIDIGFFMSNYMWEPREKEYTPKLDEKAWKKLLLDEQIFGADQYKIIKRIADAGNAASCIELSLQYGLTANFYNKNSTELAKKIHEATGCPVYIYKKDKQADGITKYWPILYMGRDAGSQEEGSYIWRLRDELVAALADDDVKKRLESIQLYEEGFPIKIEGLRIWKVSHGNNVFGEERNAIYSRHSAVLHNNCSGFADGARITDKSAMPLFKEDDYVYPELFTCL